MNTKPANRSVFPLFAVLAAAVLGSALAQPRLVEGTKRAAAKAGAARAADDAADAAKDLAEERFPGGAALKTDPEQQRLLKRADQCVEDGRLDLAAVLWQKVLDEAGDTLMTRDGRTYTSLAHEVERTLSKLPPEALRTYRIAADGEAQAVLAAAGPDREEEALAEVVQRFFLSSQGDDAAYKLACLALDRHDFVGASRLLTRILDHHPDPSMPRGDLLLRLAVASGRMGDKATAEASLAQVASSPGVRPPSEVIDLVHEDVSQASTLASAAQGATGADWHMELGHPGRSGHMVGLPPEVTSRTLSELWVQEYPLALSGPAGMNPYGGAMGMGMGGIVVFSGRMPRQPQVQAVSREDLVGQWRQHGWKPTPQLLFDGGRVYIKTPDRLVAYSTSDLGERPVWQSLWRNQYELDGRSQMLAMMAMNYGNQQFLPADQPKTPAEVMLFGDRVHQSMSIAGGMIYSLEGKAISEVAGARPAAGKPFQWGALPRRTRSNWLTAYSAAGGKVRWTRAASDEDKEGGSEVGFLAAPVPCGNVLLAPVSDGGTMWLFALSPEDGKTVWKTYLCDEPAGGAAPWSPVVVAVDGREAYLTVGCGVVFAVDAVGGTVRWAVRYQRDGKPNTTMRQIYGGNYNAMLDMNGWDDDVVIPHGRALVVLSSDSDKLLAIDRRSGAFLWDSPRTSPFGPAASYCLGVHGSGLFVAGKNVVRRYDLLGGKMIWETEIGDSFGRGCVTTSAVYVPVKDSIVKLDVEKGRELAQVGVALTNDDPVGNLFSDGEKLWVTGAGRVYAMTTLEHRLQKLAEQIAAGQPEAQLNRMRLFYKQAQREAALADLKGAYVLFQKQLSPDEAAGRLFDAIGEMKLAQDDPLTVLSIFHESFIGRSLTPLAKETLAKETLARRGEQISASISALRTKKTPGAAPAILAVAPLLEEEHLLQSAAQAVEATATKDDVQSLQAALAGQQPTVQLVSIGAFARLAPEQAKTSLSALLAGGDDRVRLSAARALANLGERQVLETFVALLQSENTRIRAKSYQSLRALTGQKIDFSPEGNPEGRNRQIAAWNAWVRAEGATAKLTLPLTDQNILLGRTLYVSQSQSVLVELDSEKKKRWETRLPGPAHGCQGLPNGHRLVAVLAHSLVLEYDADGKEVWRKEGLPGPPYTVQRLDNGSTLVACADLDQIIEIAPDGSTKPTNVRGQPVSAQRLDNGNTLVALRQGGRVVEVDPSGKITWEIRTAGGPSHAVRLENGNTLVTLMNGRQIVEYDPTGKTIVWRSSTRFANPYCAQRLASGSTLVSDFQGIHELAPDGSKIQWQHRQPGITGLSSF